MKILLCYNSYYSVSGETVFFNNMLHALQDLDIQTCPIQQSTKGITGLFEFNFRFPLLQNTSSALKACKDYDLVHFLNASLAPAGTWIKKPKIATSHFFFNSYLKLSPPPNLASYALRSLYTRYLSMIDRKTFKELDCLVASSPYQNECLKETYDLDNVRTIVPGIDTNYLRGLRKKDLRSKYGADNIIAYFGRLHERSKGISYLIDAMKYLSDTKLLIVGNGPDMKRYERQAKDDSIVFLGRLDWEEKCTLQKSADAVVMPSLYEVFCMAFAEGLACEVPVVAFDQPFWKDLYAGAGIFVEKDPKALAEGIETALHNRKTRKRVISKGKEYAEKYSIERTVKDYISLYEELV
jgi:glycosyltransferase involved in cell wall biosynthesis